MTLVALLSNPHATGNKSQLPAMRDYCARNPDVFHYEVDEVPQIANALRIIARVRPRVLVINGGDGSVQAALTELYHGGHFDGDPPPFPGELCDGGLRVTDKELGWRLIVDGANRADDEGDSELRDALTALGSRVLRA